MTVYIDQYIIINTILNFVILRITKSIIKSKSSNPRLFISSIAGALFAILILFPQAKSITGTFGKLIFSLIITAISFNSKSFRSFLKNLTVFYFVSFTIGGCGYALFNIFGESRYMDTAMLLCITVFLSYFILNIISSIYEKYFKYDNLIHKLTIKVGEKTAETECFYDTGNNLRDPVSKTPVIVVNITTIKNLLPETIIYELLHNTDIVNIYFSYCMDVKLKLIPYHTVADNGFMLGFVPTKVLIDEKETNAIIGISSVVMTKDKKYSAIVNPENI